MGSIAFLFNWCLGLVNVFAQFLTWLTTNLPYINLSPLDLFSLTGISLIIGFLLLRLVIGG